MRFGFAQITRNISSFWSYFFEQESTYCPSPSVSDTDSIVERYRASVEIPTVVELPTRNSMPLTLDELDRLLSHTTLQRFGEGLQIAANTIFPNADRQTKYSRTSVLLLYWDEEDPKLPVLGELSELSTTLRDVYHYDVEIWAIPSENSYRKLSRKILDFVDLGDEKDHLKIVYYGGHGRLDRDKKLCFSNIPDARHPRYSTLPWSGIQNMLEQSSSDVLILLDCCAAGFPNTNYGGGVTEMIAASTVNGIANGVGPCSFTSVLNNELKALQNAGPFTIAILYNNMLQSMQQKYDMKWDLYTAPIHLVLTQNAKLPRSIQLSPLPKPHNPPNIVAQELEATTQATGIAAASAIGRNSLNPRLSEFPRINLSIQLVGDVDLTEDLFIEWLRMLPTAAECVKAEAGWSSFSTLLIVSLPLAFWRYLPVDPAVNSVGIIRSSNLLIPGFSKPEFVDVKEQGHLDWEPDETQCFNLNAGTEEIQTEIVPQLPQPLSQVLILHRVYCPDEKHTTIWTDLPFYIGDKSRGERHLQGSVKVHNLQSYLEGQSSSPFVVIRDYECNYSSPKTLERLRQQSHKGKQAEEEPSILKTSIRILSEDLAKSLNHLVKQYPSSGRFPVFNNSSEIASPYLFYYHHRGFFALEDIENSREVIHRFLDYIHDSVSEEYAEADELLSKGIVTAQFVPYLYNPMDILVARNSTDTVAYKQITPLEVEPNVTNPTWNMTVESIVFDGTFRKKLVQVTISYEDPTLSCVKITDLKIYPLRFASSETVERLWALGNAFWPCRKPIFVSYSGIDNHKGLYAEQRFMVDAAVHRQIHSPGPAALGAADEVVEVTLDPEAFERDTPPGGDFALLLPHKVVGFNMEKKRWVNLHVEHIMPVDWNKEAFDRLVLEQNAKELILALTTNHLTAGTETDLIAGKGNGLIMLLHGGPGTGKTLTAESLAEYVGRPLFRVTCGDLGSKADDVERYLDTVLYLGKMWGAVILLDEADVFLEQRTLLDMERNALVSVFLRVLEYYNGILILTSNRVGSFDEAFKSRIQLALHYKPLKFMERSQLWENFICRIFKFFPDEIDRKGIMDNINALAEIELNGREIRNTLTTARQLALLRKERMSYSHLKSVIETAVQFNSYLKELHGDVMEDWVR